MSDHSEDLTTTGTPQADAAAAPASSNIGADASTFVQFIKFGIVGGSGTVVNMVAAVVVAKLFLLADILPSDPFFNLLGSQFHIRYYHLFMTLAFLIANTWNYQLNRSWTFRSDERRGWFREFLPFLATGILSYVVSLAVATALMNPESPIALPRDIFDGSTGFRRPFYWANFISILVAMPVNFVVNKLWTFRGKKAAA